MRVAQPSRPPAPLRTGCKFARASRRVVVGFPILRLRVDSWLVWFLHYAIHSNPFHPFMFHHQGPFLIHAFDYYKSDPAIVHTIPDQPFLPSNNLHICILLILMFKVSHLHLFGSSIWSTPSWILLATSMPHSHHHLLSGSVREVSLLWYAGIGCMVTGPTSSLFDE